MSQPQFTTKQIIVRVVIMVVFLSAAQAVFAGDFRNLAKIEKLRTIHGGKYRELMENIETLGKTLDRLGIKSAPGTYDPQGLNRAIGLIDAYNHKRQFGGIRWRHIPYVLQDVQAISAGLYKSTVVYNRKVNGEPVYYRGKVMTQREANAAVGAWAEYYQMVDEYNKHNP
jgi:hypothetical protein